MDKTPRGLRLHIAILGRRNAGKSSLINAITNQDIALVSSIPGTTTDPVYKAMEVPPLGPIMLVDTAGIDDEGELGQKRVKRTMKVLETADVALLVVDGRLGLSSFDQGMAALCSERKIPWLLVYTKGDLVAEDRKARLAREHRIKYDVPVLWVSSVTKAGIEELKKLLAGVKPADWQAPAIAGDLVEPGETILLVTPIDAAAPKGRLILPQVQTIRDILDHDCQCVVCKETGLKKILEKLKTPPALVVTDSQVFGKVAALVPPEIPLTSFSILMARYKGDLAALVQGAEAVASLKPGDRVLIGEACTHRCLADDIGRVKIPRGLEQAVGGSLKIDHASGYGFPEELEKYKLVVHCGGCMLNRREMLHRIRAVTSEGIPIVNYGVLIAYLHGILPRALAPFQGKEKIYEVL